MASTILPNDFDWEFYLNYHKDLIRVGFKTKEQAVNHYLKHGHKEKRIYNSKLIKNEIKNEIKKEIEIIEIKETLEKCTNYSLTNQNETKNLINYKKNNLLFTICASNYLAQAKTLGDSLLEHNKDYEFIIFLIDEIPNEIKKHQLVYNIIYIKDIGIPNIFELSNNYNITEFSTAVKPFCFNYLFKTYLEIENITYLDPDILIFNKLTLMEDMLKENDIILTPHFSTPINDDFLPSEQSILNSGIYNLGFISLKKSQNTFDFIKWWSKKLYKFCKIDLCNGLFVDQLWINLVPLYFEKVGIIKDLGYNFAYWNLHERKINESNIINNEYKLVFYHFSGYKFDDKISIHSNRYDFNKRKDILPIFCKYIELVFKNGYNFFSKLKCEYNLPKNDEGINLCGFVNQNFGLGKFCEQTKEILEELLINHNTNEVIAENHNYEKKFEVTKVNNYNRNLIFFNPDSSINLVGSKYFENKYNIGIWFWELPIMPNSWLENSKKYSEIWTPTNFINDIFKKNLPENIKIKKINFPISEPKKIDKNEAKKHFKINEDEFLCLFIFDYRSDLYRKNPHGVIETFKKTFKDNEKCKLFIKSHNGTKKQVDEMNKFIGDDNRIIFLNESLSKDELNILLNSSDVYISLHRSEGLGLTIVESILLEKPTICTNYSGNLDFCLPEWSELVDYKLTEVDNKSIYHIYKNLGNQQWAEPSIDDAVVKLKKIYENYLDYEERAKIGKKYIIKNYSLENFKKQIKNLILN